MEERQKHNRILKSHFKNRKATENEYDIGWRNLLAAKKQVNSLLFGIFIRNI